MPKKTGISFEEHQEIGKVLRGTQRYITTLLVKLAGAYARTGAKGRPYKYITKADNGLSNLRCYLEENYAKEYPNQWTTKTYYGGWNDAVNKSPEQLYKELVILTTDAQRWEWVKENQDGNFKLTIDDEQIYIDFGEVGRIDFDNSIRPANSVIDMLRAIGIYKGPVFEFIDGKEYASRKRKEPPVKVDGEDIIIEGHYYISLDECKTDRAILHWILHLLDKSWVSPAMHKEFITLATMANGDGLWQADKAVQDGE